jgi:large subunit ribosomal protein L15
MKLNELAPHPGSVKTRKRLGRGPGSGTGKTAGRGHKGQGSRSGFSMSPWFEGGQMPLQRRLPKRGFKNFFRKEYAVVNVGDLESAFPAGTTVDIAALVQAGLVKKLKDGVKLLGTGSLSKSLTVQVTCASKSALEKVQGAGGRVELSGGPAPEGPAA